MLRVDVALSGGVDSAVAAALLIKEGHEVSGVTMRLGTMTTEAEVAAAEVCGALGIEHRVVDLSHSFAREVLHPFADAYADGRTPNPCVLCNERVKLGGLLRDVLSHGADALATGHYARVDAAGERPRLLRGTDSQKDQSYFLYRLSGSALGRIRFPIGSLRKNEVRAYAASEALPARHRPESQEACFAQDRPHTDFVSERHPEALTPGCIVDRDGTVVGRHDGIARYTIGQRRGLGGGSAEPRYVVELRPQESVVVVGDRRDAESDRILATDVVWHDQRREGSCTFRFRHGTVEAAGRYAVDAEVLRLESAEPLFGVAPGQAVVCYEGDLVLGGGTIARTRKEAT